MWESLHISPSLQIAVFLLSHRRQKLKAGLLCIQLSNLMCLVSHLVLNLYQTYRHDTCLVLSFGRKNS